MYRVKFILVFMLCFNSAQASVFSNTTLEGLLAYWAQIDGVVEGWEEAIREFWATEIKNELENIQKKTAEKALLLEQIKSLESEINTSQKNKIFLLEKEKKLMGKMIDVESVR